MKRLKREILEDYEVVLNRPAGTRAVQFGDDAVLLGLVDRLIDDGNANGLDVGIAVVQAGSEGFAKELKEQDGLYTAFVRGDLNEKRCTGSRWCNRCWRRWSRRPTTGR